MDNKIIYDENRYREALKEKFGDGLDKLDPIKKKFSHMTMVTDMINSQYEVFAKNFREAADNDEQTGRVGHVFLINLQHMDMLHDKINDIHDKYIKDTSVVESFNNRVLMTSWMNVIVMCMHITKTVLPILNILNSQDIHINGDSELTSHFKEFLSLMRYMTNMSDEFENYINENMH